MNLTLPPVRALAFASSVAAFLANSAASLFTKKDVIMITECHDDNYEEFDVDEID